MDFTYYSEDKYKYFCNGVLQRGKMGSTLSKTKIVGICSQESEWGGSVGGILLKGSIRGEGGFWLNRANSTPAEGRPR